MFLTSHIIGRVAIILPKRIYANLRIVEAETKRIANYKKKCIACTSFIYFKISFTSILRQFLWVLQNFKYKKWYNKPRALNNWLYLIKAVAIRRYNQVIEKKSGYFQFNINNCDIFRALLKKNNINMQVFLCAKTLNIDKIIIYFYT